ncbi:MAG: hypothetical protein AAB677_01165 [Patescibacteria group bacterium]
MKLFNVSVALGSFVFGLVIGVYLPIFPDTPRTIPDVQTFVTKPHQQTVPELVVGYNGPDGKPFELVYDTKSRRVILRVDSSSESFFNADELERLKSEVVRLILSGKTSLPLGDSGISFRFAEGQYPIWGPHEEVGPGYNYKSLFFAEGAAIKDGIIEAQGLPNRPGHYYPYPPDLWPNSQPGSR